MKPIKWVSLTLLSVLIASGSAAAQQPRDRNNRDDRDGDRVCFYRDVQFQGPSWCYGVGDEVADLRNRGGEISSIRVFGRARVIVFDADGFTGASDAFDRDVPDLTLRVMQGRRNWNDKIDSLQVVSAFPGRGRGWYGRDNDDRDGRDNRLARDRVCVFEDTNFSGRSLCWNAGEGESNLVRVNGWNDRISSVRVFGRAHIELYRDVNFRGGRIQIDRDTADLNRMNWGDQISSLQVQ